MDGIWFEGSHHTSTTNTSLFQVFLSLGYSWLQDSVRVELLQS